MLEMIAAVMVAAAPAKVAVPGFTAVGMDQGLAEAWADRFVTLFGEDALLKVVSSKDIAQVLGIERQKELLGCSDGQNSCLAELAGALGVDAILSATFAQSGSTISATLRVIRATDGSQIAAATTRAKDVDALQDWLDAQAVELGRTVRIAFKLETAPAAQKSSSAIRWVPGIAGAALLVGGGISFGVSKSFATRLRSEPLDGSQIAAVASTGQTLEVTGAVLMIAGGAAIAASILWIAAPAPGEVSVALVPLPAGGAAVVGGSF